MSTKQLQSFGEDDDIYLQNIQRERYGQRIMGLEKYLEIIQTIF